MPVTIDDLRSFAVGRSLFAPTTLRRAMNKLGFVQADPIRAPARAQDLTLRHRVKDYRSGDLDRHYEKLGIAEDVFINYGFVTNSLQALMHPRPEVGVSAEHGEQSRLLLDFVVERGTVHPREADDYFSHGKVTNYWGGSSNATTHLLDAMHYRGLLRVVRREGGIRIYAAHRHNEALFDPTARQERLDALVDVAVNIYAPLPGSGLTYLLRRLRLAAPQWHGDLKGALQRAKGRLSQARVDGVDWYWPAKERMGRFAPPDTVRLLAPFDPVVWDRDRFELLWGWEYRFEAYTPAPKRKRGYYALPLLWRDRVIGWGNLSVKNGELTSDIGYVGLPPGARVFKRELEAELNRLRIFLEARAMI
jgi:uncharacterized protein YcaQ